MQLVEKIYKWLAHFKPYPLCHTETSSLAQYHTFCCYCCLIQMGPILHHPSELMCNLFPATVAICYKRVLGYHRLLDFSEEDLGTIWSCLIQNQCRHNCCHYRYSSAGAAADSLYRRARSC